MNNLDLDKVQEAMDWLGDTAEGDQALKGLAEACDALQSKIPTQLNHAEMRYILERLMSQRSLGDWDKKLEPAEVSAYVLQTAGGLFPTLTGLSHSTIPVGFTSENRVLNYGFVIRAEIPVSSFSRR